MMADIIAFRTSAPVIIVEGGAKDGYWVRVRPCPDHLASLSAFKRLDAAMAFAQSLEVTLGASIRIDVDAPGGAA